jgi:hypothetical protein
MNQNYVSDLPRNSILLVDFTGELGLGNDFMGLALKSEETLGRSFSTSWIDGLADPLMSVAKLKGICFVGSLGGQDFLSNKLFSRCT